MRKMLMIFGAVLAMAVSASAELTIQSFQVFQTNSFPYGATLGSAAWAPWNVWNARVTFVAPTPGVYVVEANYQLHGVVVTPDGWGGMNWTELNTSPWIFFTVDGVHYAQTGRYTVAAAGTYTIEFPIPIWEVMFFRMKRLP